MAELVVLAALLLVGKNLIGLAYLLEFTFGDLVVWAHIGVIFFRKGSICFFYFIITGIPAYAQDFVVISLV
ncbi:hypothetical protein SDC9_152275 [bioreactor metagenome]|uniref:Uncharacterized protein n=1 Tax=bioreactor metagenome TaxID=1076179 RepID=A0A645EUC3_9ZZZZ